MISKRLKAGLARAKNEGKTLGRPRVSSDVEEQILALRSEGKGMLAIAKLLGIGTSTVQRVARN